MKYIVGIVIGLFLTQIPDIVLLYAEHVGSTYQKIGCQNIEKNKCYFNFNGWFDKYEEENKLLVRFVYYYNFQQGPLYWIASGRCSNQIFYNPSASKHSGKITMRNYFRIRCSNMMNDISDFIFKDAEKEQMWSPEMETF